VTRYLSSKIKSHAGAIVFDNPAERPGDEHARLCAIRLYNQNNETTSRFESSRPIIVELELDILELTPDLEFGFDLMKPDGVVVLRTLATDIQDSVPLRLGRNRYRAAIPGGLLNGGSYEVAPLVALFCKKWIVRADPKVSCEVLFTHGLSKYTAYPDRWKNGLIAPMIRWNAEAAHSP